MDAVIDFDEVADFLKNPPSLEPRPDFTKIRALRKHIVTALAQLQCPQEAIHGWSGLAVDPAAYQLLTGKVFIIPPDPGATAVYPAWAAPNDARTIDATFLRAKNYYLSYVNIHRACFRMLDALVSAQFKVSNNPNLTGWNATMSVLDILTQLQDSYGKPDMMTIFKNETLYRSPMAPSDSPEVLFYRIEQCQEVQLIGKVPFTTEQIIANAVRILIGSNLLPTKEFDTWEALPIKTWATLKTFFQAAYGRRLTSLAMRSTTGQHGYATQNMYHVFDGTNDDTDDDTVTTITPITTVGASATATTSTLGTAQPPMPATINAEIAAATNQLSQNQTAIMSQMAALSFTPAPANPATRYRAVLNVPPIQQLAVPIQQFPAGNFGAGRGGQRGGGGRGRVRGGRGRTPFADYMRTRGGAGAGIPGQDVPYGGGIVPAVNTGIPQARNPDFSNIYKRHNNWNVCFSCGFDIEDGHTSMTCPFKKANHQQAFSRENAQQFISAGYDPCTKGMHKTVLPGQRNA